MPRRQQARMSADSILDMVGLLWPFVLTVCVGLMHWRRFHSLKSRAGFLVAGVLGCFGLQAFLARLTRYVFWTFFAPVQPGSHSIAVHFTDPIVIIVASALVSVPLLHWLTALVALPQPSGNR